MSRSVISEDKDAKALVTGSALILLFGLVIGLSTNHEEKMHSEHSQAIGSRPAVQDVR